VKEFNTFDSLQDLADAFASLQEWLAVEVPVE